MLAVEILVQTVVVIRPILKQQRRGSDLSRLVTARQILGVRLRILNVDAHRGIPSIGDIRQARIQSGTKIGDDRDGTRHFRLARVGD